MIELKVFPLVSPDFVIGSTIDGTVVSLRFVWNFNTNYWVLNTYSEPNNGVEFHCIKVKPYWNLLENLINEDHEVSLKGALMLVNESQEEEEMTYENFGTTWKLVYFSETEFEEWSEYLGL